MILHIFLYDKFDSDYIKRINTLYDQKGHLFFIYGKKIENNIPSIENCNNVVFSTEFPNLVSWMHYLIKEIKTADRVIIHSLMSRFVLLALFVCLRSCKSKYFWMIWGADLYNAYWNRNKSLIWRLRELIRKRVIKGIPAVGYIQADYEFLKKHYESGAKFHKVSYTYDFNDYPKLPKDKSVTNILLANSASKDCRYEEMIEKISSFKDIPSVRVYCVLSYPKDTPYINEVVKLGRECLGDSFIPLIDYMTYNEYTKFLSDIDIAIFNHDRQQALGNIASLAYYGKVIYINKQNGCKGYFEDMGVKLFDTDSFCEDALCIRLTPEEINHNKRSIEFFYSDEQFKKRWDAVFYSEW